VAGCIAHGWKGGGGVIHHSKEKGAAATDPNFKNQAAISYTLPARYRKPNRYCIDQEMATFRGKQAFVLDRLIDAKPDAMEHTSTMYVVSALRDVIRHLKQKGVIITKQKRQNTVYFLQSSAIRLEGQT
jgi:hypothetical protein